MKKTYALRYNKGIKMFKYLIKVAGFCFAFSGVSMADNYKEHLDNKDLQQLAAWMTGEVNNFKQTREKELGPDSIKANVVYRIIRVFEDLPDGYYLLAEQSNLNSQDKPFRQRIYHIDFHPIDAAKFLLTPYKYKRAEDAATSVGIWRNIENFSLSIEDFIEVNCMFEFRRNIIDGAFEGSTVGKTCAGSWGKTSYILAGDRIAHDGIQTWEQGFDNKGNFLWGVGPDEATKYDPAVNFNPELDF